MRVDRGSKPVVCYAAVENFTVLLGSEGLRLVATTEDLPVVQRVLAHPGLPTTVPDAILDRLLHHATTQNVKGESYRLKEKKRSGLLGAPAPTSNQFGPRPDADAATDGEAATS